MINDIRFEVEVWGGGLDRIIVGVGLYVFIVLLIC